MKNLYEVTLPSGKVVAFRELKVSEMGHVMSAGKGLDAEAAGFEMKLAGLRYAIVEVGGRPVKYEELVGDRWDELFSVSETFLLFAAWSQVHEPTRETTELVGKSIRVRSSGT